MNDQPAAPAETTAPAGDLTAQMEQLLGGANALRKSAPASDDEVSERIAETAATAIGEVYGSVEATLDELQTRITELRSRAATAHTLAVSHIRGVVLLSADSIRASDTIKIALDKLDESLGVPR